MEEKIIKTFSNGVLELKMNFNENNSFNFESFSLIAKSLQEASQNQDVRVLLLSSQAQGFFSNGLDPNMFIGKSAGQIREAAKVILSSAADFYFFPWPTIAVISGHTMGAGSVMSIAADFRFMAEKKTRFSFPESQIAMNFPAFSSKILMDLVGQRQARDLLYFGKALKSAQALEIGLVDEVYPNEILSEKAWEFARKLAEKPKESLTGMKKSLREGMKELNSSLREFDIEEMVSTILTENTQEGFRSILEKRRPVFQ